MTKVKPKLALRIKELENKLKRVLADYDNLQKRVEKEKNRWVKLANAELVDKLLAILDDLERVEKHRTDQGLKMALDQFRRVLQSEGVTEMTVKGKKFNAQLMDCVAMTRGAKNQVVEVVKKGYFLNGCVLRPAEVKVGGTTASRKGNKNE